MIVTLDKEDFVVSAQREPSDEQTVSAIKEIENADVVPLPMQTCKGPYHNKRGEGTSLPITEFSTNRNHELNKTCDKCLTQMAGQRASVYASRTETQICKGPWHRNKGEGTPLPLSAFRISKYSGKLNKTCTECLESKNGVLPTPVSPVITPLPEVAGTHFQHGVEPSNPKWRITIIQRVVVEVYATDFLDAAAQAGEGEVVKVERVN